MKKTPPPARAEAETSDHAAAPDRPFDLKTLLRSLTALKRGDFTVRMPVEWPGVAGRVADTFNDVVELNERLARELERISELVGKRGRITQRATLGNVSGSWDTSV